MKLKLKRISVKNFKSLKNSSIDLKKLNILVGPNGSGKTNLVELFELIKSIYFDKELNPFFKWWGYDHVVWNHEEQRNIEVQFEFDLDQHELSFLTIFTGQGGQFQFIKEEINLHEIVKITKEGQWIEYEYSSAFLEKFYDEWNLRKKGELVGIDVVPLTGEF